jgi:GDP-L-fucose synthase
VSGKDEIMLGPESRIYVAGHRGLVGSAIVRGLARRGISSLITRTHSELDLTNQEAVRRFFEQERPEFVVLAAARVGGIHANNTYPADFIYDNLMIEANVINAAFVSGVERLLFLGRLCIYPCAVEQPMREDALLTGILEPTNEPYAVAKIAGIKLCESFNRQHGTDYRSVMLTNLYGQGDNFHNENSHVIPALMRRFHEAKVRGEKQVMVWGSGKPRREFLHVDDMAEASIHVLELDAEVYRQNTEPMLSHINVGTGADVTIRELAEKIKRVVGFDGDIVFDDTKPDGTMRKLMSVERLVSLGWVPEIDLERGLRLTYEWFVDNYQDSVVRM